MVGELLEKLEALGIADDTIVIFTTDNGAEKFSWPGPRDFLHRLGGNEIASRHSPGDLRWASDTAAGCSVRESGVAGKAVPGQSAIW